MAMIDDDVLSDETYDEKGSNKVYDEEVKLFDDIVGFLESLLGKAFMNCFTYPNK